MTATVDRVVARVVDRVRRAGLIAPDTFDDVFDRPGSVRAVAVLRIVLGPVVLGHLWPFLRDTATGTTYDDRFYEPWFGFDPGVPGWVQVVLVWTGAVAAVGMAAGWRTRWTSAITTASAPEPIFAVPLG